MRRFLLLLAALVFANVLFAQNDSRLHVRKLELIPNDTEASRAKKKDANGDKCALLKIQTPNMDEAERNRLVVEADRGTFLYPVEAVGELKIFLTEGVKILVFRHPDYGVLTYNVKENIEGNKVYKVVIEADKIPGPIPPNPGITLNSNYVNIKVMPADAIISVDGQFYTKRNIQLTVDEPHALEVSHPLYHTYEQTIYASADKKMSYDVKLAPAFGWLNITSKPENGATVLIDKKRVGVTPFRSDTLKSGEYEVTLLKDMYESVTKTVVVRDNNVGEVEITMKPKFADITINTDKDSDIYVDNEKKGKGSWKDRLGEGQHIVEARKASHRSTKTAFDVIAGEPQTITVTAPTPIYGALDITSEPDEATVYLDGAKIGETPLVQKNVLIGSHSLRFEKNGCAPSEMTAAVEEGKIKEVSGKLQTGRAISISTDGTGDKIFVDGKYIGESPLTATMSFGEHEIIVIRGYDGDVNALTGGGTNVLNAIKAINGVNAATKKVMVSQTGGANSVQLTFSIGAINGVFSVSSSRKVQFSQGNLQYQASTKTWRFAEHQWDMIGDANKNISSSYSGWIDLFGWGTGNNPTKSSTSNSDYSSFTDWGNNTISNGGGKSWFTLTKDEWVYVFNTRSTSSGIRYAKAIVNGVNGVILLPDNWSTSNYSLSNTNKTDASFSSNRISQTDWTNKFEANGAVFLPAAGWRYGTSVGGVGSYGYYWSASYEGSDSAYNVNFSDGNLYADNWYGRYYGLSVRLVCSAEN